MAQAQSIEFKVANLDSQFKTMFPTSFNQALTNSQQVTAARPAQQPMAAFQQTMTVQAQITENIATDTAIWRRYPTAARARKARFRPRRRPTSCSP
jgi:conjugal transfer/entry exclusion protein